MMINVCRITLATVGDNAALALDFVGNPARQHLRGIYVGLKLVGFILVIGAAWGAFTTFVGIAGFFDLAMTTKMNPVQFMFALVLTSVVFGFVIASHVVWSFKSDDIPTLIMKAAWVLCVLIVFYAALRGTKQFVFGDGEIDLHQRSGLILVTFLVVAASILLSKLILARDIRGKPFLF